MAWLEGNELPSWLATLLAKFNSLHRSFCGLRASPRLLVAICMVQFAVLLIGFFQQHNRTECAVGVPPTGSVIIECDACFAVSIGMRGILLHILGAGVISCGLLAVLWRSQYLLYIYGSSMLFFAILIGITAMLTALEEPMLELAVGGVDAADGECMERALNMLEATRNHATLAALGCLVDTSGAILAIRSKELFSYEEIASKHAEVATSSGL